MGQFLGNMYTEVSVQGIGSITARYEQTDPSVAQQYVTDILPLVDLYQQSSGSASTWTSTQVNAATTALQNLLSLAQNGLNGNYLTTSMAQKLDLLVRSFESVGATVSNGVVTFPSDAVGALQQWKDSTVLSPLVSNLFQEIITAQTNYGTDITTVAGANAATLNKSLQSQIEVDYVQTANNMLNTQLTGLQNTLTYLNSVNGDLANLQNLHNDMTINSRTGLKINYSGAWSAGLQASYQKLASNYFGSPIVPTVAANLFDLTGGGLSANPNNYVLGKVVGAAGGNVILSQVVAHPSHVFIVLTNVNSITNEYYYYYAKTISPALNSTGMQAFAQLLQTKQDLQSQIANLSGTLSQGALSDRNGLYAQLKSIVSDLNTNLTAPNGTAYTLSNYQNSNMGGATGMFSGFRTWLVDNYNATGAQTSKSGLIQQHISTAITAAQNLNSSQTEHVRNFMYLMQEFYQSASSVLQAISQIIQKVAQGIKGS